MKDYYLILDISPFATQIEIKEAYKKMSLKYHPDTNKEDRYFEERFKDIQEAYYVLSDIIKRKEYDYNRFGEYRKHEDSKSGSSDLKKRRDELNVKEEKFLILSKPLKKKADFSKKNQKKYNIFLTILIFLITTVFIIFFIIYNDYKLNQIRELQNKLNSLNENNLYLADQLNLTQDSLLLINRKYQKLIENSQNKNKSAIPKLRVDNSRANSIENYFSQQNSSEIELINIDWTKINDNEEVVIKSFSIYNKTNNIVNKVSFHWVMLDKQNRPVSFGDFSIGFIKGDKMKIGNEYYPVDGGQLNLPPNLSKNIEVNDILGLNFYDWRISSSKGHKLELTVTKVFYKF